MVNKAKAIERLELINKVSQCEWILISFDEVTGIALVISKNIIRMMPYDYPGGKPITWNEATSRLWLNGEFYKSLPNELKERIVKTRIVTPDNCAIPGGADTEDYIFLLSIDEYDILAEEIKPATLDGVPCWWWLRSPGYAATDVANVMPNGVLDGGLSGHGFYSHCDCGGIRPAMYLNLK